MPVDSIDPRTRMCRSETGEWANGCRRRAGYLTMTWSRPPTRCCSVVEVSPTRLSVVEWRDISTVDVDQESLSSRRSVSSRLRWVPASDREPTETHLRQAACGAKL